jgi:hypothetical protein
VCKSPSDTLIIHPAHRLDSQVSQPGGWFYTCFVGRPLRSVFRAIRRLPDPLERRLNFAW